MESIPATGSLQAQVHEALRKAILSGELKPGSLYSVKDLSSQLGVSRTPVREAALKLASAGMVRFERNRGMRVLETSWQDLEEVFGLRLLLEVPATRHGVHQLLPTTVETLSAHLAQMRAAAAAEDPQAFMDSDRAFHRTLLEASGNLRLAAYVDTLRDMVLKRGQTTVGRSRGLIDIAAEHATILAAVELRDADEAARQMQRHILHTAHLLLGQERAAAQDERAPDLSWALSLPT
ncbi:MAG: GntR family transcriptional regulator [Mycobacteriales bacterium]